MKNSPHIIPFILRSNWIRIPLLLSFVFVVSACIGAYFNLRGIIGWDDEIQYHLSRAILGEFGLNTMSLPNDHNRYYAPLWEFFLGLNTEFIFSFLRDPILVRHALTFALFPSTIVLTFLLLRYAAVPSETAALVSACIFGIIRYGGHSLMNVKDAPVASFYLLVSLSIWILLQKCHEKGFHPIRLIVLGIVAGIPFLLRVPLVLHGLLLMAFLVCYVCFVRNKQTKTWVQNVLVIGIPLLCYIGIIVALYPPYWTTNWHEWLKPFTVFGDLAPVTAVRLLGKEFGTRGGIPAWFSLVWIPIITHPLVFVSATFGFVVALYTRKSVGASFVLHIRRWKINVSLTRWLFITFLLSFAAIFVQAPYLYDEERQLLFLYPLVIVFGALGLHILSRRAQLVLTITIVVLSAMTYLQWGVFSYIYKSPFFNQNPRQFTGDYWGICISEAVNRLPEHMQSTIPFVTDVNAVANMQLVRLRSSLLVQDERMKDYRLVGGDPPEAFVRIHTNRFANPYDRLQGQRNPKLLSEITMPPNAPVCLTILYDAAQQ